jgi:DedD protein
VFFGFGYSTGRTLHGAKSPAAAAPAVEAPGSAQASAVADGAGASTTTPPLAAVQPVAKPSPGAPLSDAGAEAASRDEAATAQTAEEPGFPPSASLTAAPAARPAPAVVAVDAPASALPAAAGGVMVQIAAVMRQADADMLAHALRTNGYAAVVRSEPQDKFLHVQVGPFATRDQAKAMRARLLGDGYNAFLKP